MVMVVGGGEMVIMVASGGVVERYWWLWQCWSWWRDGNSGGRGGGVGGERVGFGEEVGWFLWWKVLPTGAMMVIVVVVDRWCREMAAVEW